MGFYFGSIWTRWKIRWYTHISVWSFHLRKRESLWGCWISHYKGEKAHFLRQVLRAFSSSYSDSWHIRKEEDANWVLKPREEEIPGLSLPGFSFRNTFFYRYSHLWYLSMSEYMHTTHYVVCILHNYKYAYQEPS